MRGTVLPPHWSGTRFPYPIPWRVGLEIEWVPTPLLHNDASFLGRRGIACYRVRADASCRHGPIPWSDSFREFRNKTGFHLNRSLPPPFPNPIRTQGKPRGLAYPNARRERHRLRYRVLVPFCGDDGLSHKKGFCLGVGWSGDWLRPLFRMIRYAR